MKESEPDRNKLFQIVQVYIEQNYQKTAPKEFSWLVDTFFGKKFSVLSGSLTINGTGQLPKMSSSKPMSTVLDAILKLTEKPFSAVLVAMIRRKGRKAADIYIKAGTTININL